MELYLGLSVCPLINTIFILNNLHRSLKNVNHKQKPYYVSKRK